MAGRSRFPKCRNEESPETPRSVYPASELFRLRGMAETLALPDFRTCAAGIDENEPRKVGGMVSVGLAPENPTPFILSRLAKTLKAIATGFVRSICGGSVFAASRQTVDRVASTTGTEGFCSSCRPYRR